MLLALLPQAQLNFSVPQATFRHLRQQIDHEQKRPFAAG